MAKDYKQFAKPKKTESSATDVLKYDTAGSFREITERTTFMYVPPEYLVDFRGITPFEDYFNTEKFETLLRDIEANGIITPLILRKISNEKYEVLAGKHRARAAKQLGIKVPANVIASDTSEDTVMMIHLNTNLLNGRDKLSLYETIHAIAEYDKILTLQPGKRTDKEDNSGEKYDRYLHLGEIFKIPSRRTVVKYVKTGREMPDDILRKVSDKDIPFSVAYRIMALEDESFKNDLYTFIRQGTKLSMMTLESLIKEYDERNNAGITDNSEEYSEMAADSSNILNTADTHESKEKSSIGETSAVPLKVADHSVNKKSRKTTLDITEFDNIVKDSKKKKNVTMKLSADELPSRFIRMDTDARAELIIQLLKNWDANQ